MSDTYIALVILMLGIGSLLTRAGYLMLGQYFPLSKAVSRGLRYAPVAALTAIVVPSLLPWTAGEWPQVGAEFFAAVAAALAFLRVRNILFMIGVGMIILWLLRWLF
ncbi:membrane protein [Advenella kashmirensis W13003]|uniref:Membrane protein n=1 Tax=Advenella kashmirensis W13003 TaxID=1424334 RepID=V8QNC7_9BURK|nr:AzlD domain-containing protein [Advenella kashmirensis]ETF00838.1 membrane protein [Advenella kashmirensis W13003]